MVRNYKKKTKRGEASPEDILAASKDIENKRKTVAAATIDIGMYIDEQ